MIFRVSAAMVMLVLSSVLTEAARADTAPDIGYDIYSRDDRLTVWLDLSPFITSRMVDQLREGIDLAIYTQAELLTSRRFFGQRQVARGERLLKLRFQSVTKQYQVTISPEVDAEPRLFPSLSRLHQFLRDSIEVGMIPIDSLDSGRRYRLQLKITTVSLTDLNLTPTLPNNQIDDSPSPLKFLFKQFLDFTGYGRKEYEIRSRDFSSSELVPIELPPGQSR